MSFFHCFLFDLCLAVHTIGYMVSMWRLCIGFTMMSQNYPQKRRRKKKSFNLQMLRLSFERKFQYIDDN